MEITSKHKYMNTYKTSQIARIVGIHPNTVRLYEKLKLIPAPERLPNGYRVFNDFHVEQCKLVRVAFKVEVLQSGLRKKIVDVVKASANRDFDKAIMLVGEYIRLVEQEQLNAENAIEIVRQILSDDRQPTTCILTRKETARLLDVSVDSLRNWEANGLLSVARKANGYRVYTDDDVQMLRIIRTLRRANYSLEAILRLTRRLSEDPQTDVRATLNTPRDSDDIISVCDKLIASLSEAKRNAQKVLDTLTDMKARF